jgi:anti-anti-sigma regulatory factor
MLRIQKSEEGELVVLRLIGRIEAEGLAALQTLVRLESRNHELILNLKDVILVDRDAVKFLGRCEADSIKLRNCPAYIRRWITRQTENGERGE